MFDSIGWLEVLGEAVLLVGAFVLVYEGCRRLVRNGVSRGPALMVAVALILPVWEASMSLRVMKTVHLLQAQEFTAVALHGREPDGGWEKAPLSPEARTAQSTEAATINYLFQGRLVEYIDAHGNRALFNPTQELLRNREQFVRDEKGAEDSGRAAFERGVRLFANAALFMLAGLVVGWRQRGRA